MNGRSVVFDHTTRQVRADDREAFRLMKPGTRYGELPKRLRRAPPRGAALVDRQSRIHGAHLVERVA